MQDLIDRGLALHAQISEASSELEEIKAKLRAEALRSSDGTPGAITYTSPLGEVVVVVPSEKIRVRRGVDLKQAQKVMGEAFPDAFDVVTKIQPRRDLESRIGEFQGDALSALFTLIEVRMDTPRVSFSQGDARDDL